MNHGKTEIEAQKESSQEMSLEQFACELVNLYLNPPNRVARVEQFMNTCEEMEAAMLKSGIIIFAENYLKRRGLMK
jgi:hypothetical protein